MRVIMVMRVVVIAVGTVAVIVTMPVTMVMIVMGMSVPMAVSVCAACRVRAVSAALRFEGQARLGHLESHESQHLGQHMVRLELQVIRLHFELHMAVAKMVGGARQIKRRAAVCGGPHQQHRLWGSFHTDHRAVFGDQHVAPPDYGSPREEHAQAASE